MSQGSSRKNVRIARMSPPDSIAGPYPALRAARRASNVETVPASRRGEINFVGCWELMPEGGVVHRDQQTAVIADVHLGYEWARGSAGDCVPAHSLSETLAKLENLLDRTPVKRLIVAGDLVEPHRPCVRTAADVDCLARWLCDRGIELALLEGNHDRSLGWMIESLSAAASAKRLTLESHLVVDGWTIAHGHKFVPGERSITGHHHPVLRVSGYPAPCFLASERSILLPAFSFNAAGWNVGKARLPEGWNTDGVRCIVSTGLELLDFGPLQTLAASLP